MRNLEYKAELRDPALAALLLRRAGAAWIEDIDQHDTHYRVPNARLLRRAAPGRPVAWLMYSRRRAPGAMPCDIQVFSDQQARTKFGVRPLPPLADVCKRRSMWLRGRVRINIDEVRALGWFVELEIRLSPTAPAPVAAAQIARLRAALAPALGEPVTRGYAELVRIAADFPGDPLESLLLPPSHAA